MDVIRMDLYKVWNICSLRCCWWLILHYIWSAGCWSRRRDPLSSSSSSLYVFDTRAYTPISKTPHSKTTFLWSKRALITCLLCHHGFNFCPTTHSILSNSFQIRLMSRFVLILPSSSQIFKSLPIHGLGVNNNTLFPWLEVLSARPTLLEMCIHTKVKL